MSDPKVLQAKIAAAASSGEVTPSGDVPTAFLERSVDRVGYLALAFSIVFTLAVLPFWIMQFTGGPWPEGTTGEDFLILRVFNLIGIGAGLLTYWMTRQKNLAPNRALDFGLAFGVLGSFAISASEYTGVHVVYLIEASGGKGWRGGVGISWVCLWIITFAEMAPNSPRKTLLASFAAASSGPIVLALNLAIFGADIKNPVVVVQLFWPNFVAAIMAFLTSRFLNQLGREMSQAMAMGSYQLDDMIGRGGMGEVWRAEHRMLARPAALQLIRAASLGPKDARSV